MITWFASPPQTTCVDEIHLLVDGQMVGLNAAGQATFNADRLGMVELVAMATDSSGNQGQRTLTVTVANPGSGGDGRVPDDPTLPPVGPFDPTDNLRPFVEITNPSINEMPEDGESQITVVTKMIDVTGTVDDPEDNLWYWRVTTRQPTKST
ncbi:MAG: hypothetical protein R3C03_17740 [Pirellulaceae bacterium]